MRRNRGWLLAVAMVGVMLTCLGGCGGGSPFDISALDLNKSYSFTANATNGNAVVSADFARVGEDKWSVTINEPYEMQGVALYYRDGKVKASYAGITVDITDIPGVSTTADKIVGVMENAIKNEGTETVKSRESVTITGHSDYGPYTIKFDPKTGVPLSASIPDEKIEIVFDNVTVSSFEDLEVIVID